MAWTNKDLPAGTVGLSASGQVMVGSFSSLSMSDSALFHCLAKLLLLVQAVGSLADFMVAAMLNRMSARLGRWGASWYMPPSRRSGQMGSFQLGILGKNSLVTCRIRMPGHAGLWVLSDSRFISSADLGKRRSVVFGFGPVPVFEALSR